MGHNAGPAPTTTAHEFTCKTCGCQALAFIAADYEWPEGVKNLECIDCMTHAALTASPFADAWQHFVDVALTALGVRRLVAWLSRRLEAS